MKSLLSQPVARRLWWLVHNNDTTGVFRRKVEDGLQRGFLRLKLTKAERAAAVTWTKAEINRLGTAKEDDTLANTKELLAFLESA